MKGTRRRFLWSLAGVASGTSLARFSGDSTAAPQPSSEVALPDPSNLEGGDLLWPKRPGTFVPYDSTSNADFDAQREQWYREKRVYIRRMRDSTDVKQEELNWVNRLEGMSFAEFIRLYQGDYDEEFVARFGGVSPLYVGHVAIVDRSTSVPSIIEALGDKGVVRSSFADWLVQRAGQLVWHGRLTTGSSSERAEVAVVASRYIGTPYNFWNFDLSDESGFYCSKLAWWSIYTALKLAPDDRPYVKRLFWYSPKQLMKSKHVQLLLNPGSYTIS